MSRIALLWLGLATSLTGNLLSGDESSPALPKDGTRAAQSVAADDPPPALPKDGTWTKYYAILHRDDGVESRWTNKISFVGGEQWNGEPCRWVEFEEVLDGQDKPLQINKFLVPEKDLLQSEWPLDSVKRWISKRQDQITVQKEDFLDRAGLWGMSLVFLPGSLKETKTIAESKQIDYQAGKLSLEKGRQGTYVWKPKYADPSLPWKWDYTCWMHADVHFGFAYARMKLTDNLARVGEYEYLLKETGTGAKSAIGD